MKKQRRIYRWMRHPRTTAEKRANQDTEYVRGRRLPKQLVDTYDDINICTQKSWKKKRKKQYRVNGRGHKHAIILHSNRLGAELWKLEEYFQGHDIPYCVDTLYKTERTLHYYYRDYRQVKSVPMLLGKTIYWKPIYKYVIVPYDEPKTYKISTVIGYKITWWSHKDIGVEYILGNIAHKISFTDKVHS